VTTLQVPSVAPADFVHRPPQHARSVAQASPFWVQYDTEIWHVPFEQRPEQQSVLTLQVFPPVLQDVFSAAQVPFVHLPPQH